MNTSLAHAAPPAARKLLLARAPAKVVPIEDRLIRRARNGDLDAQEALVLAHSPRLYRLARSLTRSDADAQEILQDAFLLAFQRLGSFRGEASFGTWLRRIATNLVLMRRRHDSLCPHLPLEEMDLSEVENLTTQPEWHRPDQAILDAELREVLVRAVEELPSAYRAVVVLRDIEGLSAGEIAEELGESPAAVKSRLHRARLQLRATIEAFYRDHNSAHAPVARVPAAATAPSSIKARWANPPTKS
jgi:RNA polymerase sigma-70 factor (ECF subfamily)